MKIIKRVLLFFMAVIPAIVCHSQESVNDSVATTQVQQLSQEDITKGKDLARRGIGLYTGKNGYKRDFEKAREALLEAAQLNNSDAECVLAHMYENGNGVEQDYAIAAQWYRKAAEKNVATAQSSLAYFYDEGLGVEQSFIEAAKWYKKAADNNYASAQYNYADMLVNGIGVEKDLAQGLEYYKKAKANGVQQAASEISKTERLIMSINAGADGSETGEDQAFFTVDVLPEYPGGSEALLEYLRRETRYPAVCRENKIEGRVLVTFIINRDGSIEAPEVVRGVHSALDNEAIRVISNMQAWKPGMLNGKLVRVKYTVPINFRLK